MLNGLGNDLNISDSLHLVHGTPNSCTAVLLNIPLSIFQALIVIVFPYFFLFFALSGVYGFEWDNLDIALQELSMGLSDFILKHFIIFFIIYAKKFSLLMIFSSPEFAIVAIGVLVLVKFKKKCNFHRILKPIALPWSTLIPLQYLLALLDKNIFTIHIAFNFYPFVLAEDDRLKGRFLWN